MAGQRGYYGDAFWTTRGPVIVSAQIQLNGASAPTLLAGHGVTMTHTGDSNDCVVTFPEKYGKCTRLVHDYVTPASHSAAFSTITSNYSSTTGKATFSIVFCSGTTVNATTADNDPTGVLYVTAEFELGS